MHEIDYLTVGPISWDTTVRCNLKNLIAIKDIQFIPDGILINPGGTALNNAVALQTQITNIGICGVTGKDTLGSSSINAIQQLGINTDFIRQDLPQTSRSVIFLDSDGTRIILNDPKSLSDYRYPEGQFRSVLTGVPFAYFSIAQFSQNLIPLAKQHDTRIATDLQVIEKLTSDHDKALKNADIIFMNGAKLIKPDEEVVKEVWKYGVPIVVITHDKNGISLGNRDNQSFRRFPAIPNQLVVDSTGAGDSFCGIFCACLSQGKTLEESVWKALIYASNKISFLGSINGRMTASELEEAYKQLLNKEEI